MPRKTPPVLPYLAVIAATAIGTAAIAALLMNINERKHEARARYIQWVPREESTADPAAWGVTFPSEYDGYKRTVDTQRTRYGGSEAFSKIDQDPAWKRFFAGYAFGVEYREERGHAYSLSDQKLTLRTQQFEQPGACLQCHAGGMKHVYETAGHGDLQAGFAKINAMKLAEAWQLVDHPIACIDCHDPETMQLRVTRPGFLNAIKLVKAKEGIENYDPNTMATRQEMRTFVCGQCHVEYHFKGKEKMLTYPWHNGLKVEQIEAYYDEQGFSDWTHAETGARVLKAQHPEFARAQRGRVRRLPHAVQARRRHEGDRPPHPQPAAERLARLPAVPPFLGRRNGLPCARDPGPDPRIDGPGRSRAAGADRGARCGQERGRLGRPTGPGTRLPAQGAVPAGFRFRGELHGLPRPARNGPRPRRGHRLRAAGDRGAGRRYLSDPCFPLMDL
jgi:hypothetical protein